MLDDGELVAPLDLGNDEYAVVEFQLERCEVLMGELEVIELLVLL